MKLNRPKNSVNLVLLLCISMSFFVCLAGCGSGDDGGAIPLKEVYGTTGQQGLKNLGRKNLNERTLQYWRNTVQTAKLGPSMIFMVRGSDINEAVAATSKVLLGFSGVDTPPYVGGIVDRVGEKKTISNKCWLVVYFGAAGSGPPKWPIHSIQRNKQTIEIRFTEASRGIELLNINHNFIWVELGELRTGTYQLRVVDQRSSELHLARRVRVTGKMKSEGK